MNNNKSDSITTWSLIRKLTDGEFDCIPNNWLISQNECLYPEETPAALKRLAKLGQQPGSEWPKIPIEIIKRDYENYDRCAMNVYRKEMGKQTLTSSENELTKPRVTKKKTNSEAVVLSTAIKEKSESYSRLPQLGNFFDLGEAEKTKELPGASAGPSATSSEPPKGTKNVASSATEKTPKRKSGCHYPPDRIHLCTFEKGPEINMRVIAMQMCSISRSIYLLNEKMKEIQEQIQTTYRPTHPDEAISGQSTPKEKEESEDEANADDIAFMAKFPFQTLEKLLEFDLELDSNIELQKETAKAFNRIVNENERKSYPRATTILLRCAIGEPLADAFTWKGHARKGHTTEKKPLKDLALAKLIIHVVKKRFSLKDTTRIKKTIAGWLSQTRSKKRSQMNSQED